MSGSARLGLRVTGVAAAALVALGASHHDDRRLSTALGVSGYAELRDVARGAREAGLPEELVLDKALEGVAKGGAPDAVLRVTREFALELDIARRGLVGNGARDRRVDAAELRAAVSAIEAGVPETAIAALRAAAPARSLIMPLTVAADLVSRDVPWARASALLTARLRAGATDGELRSILAMRSEDVAGK